MTARVPSISRLSIHMSLIPCKRERGCPFFGCMDPQLEKMFTEIAELSPDLRKGQGQETPLVFAGILGFFRAFCHEFYRSTKGFGFLNVALGLKKFEAYSHERVPPMKPRP